MSSIKIIMDTFNASEIHLFQTFDIVCRTMCILKQTEPLKILVIQNHPLSISLLGKIHIEQILSIVSVPLGLRFTQDKNYDLSARFQEFEN